MSLFTTLFGRTQTLFIDLDGTIYNKDMIISGGEVTSDVALTKNVCFVSNTGCKTDDDVYNRLLFAGISIPRHRFVCYTAREHLLQKLDGLVGENEIMIAIDATRQRVSEQRQCPV